MTNERTAINAESTVPEKLLTLEDCAEFLGGASRSKLYNYVKKKDPKQRLNAKKFGRTYVVTRAELVDFQARLMRGFR